MAQKKKTTVFDIGMNLTNIIALTVLVLLVGLGGNFLGKHLQSKNALVPQVQAAQTIAYNGEDGKTALELLRQKANVSTQDTSLGTFVLSVNGVANSSDHFWMFYVNNELGSVGADQYQTKSTDKIEWRYDQIQ